MQQFLCILIRESTTFVTFSECINSQCYENIIWSKSRAQRWCLTLRCISTPTNWSIDCDQRNIYTQWTHRLHCTIYKSINSMYRSHNIESHSKQVAQIARRTVLVLHLNFFLFFGHLHFIPLHHQRVNKPRCDRVCVVCTPHTPAHCAAQFNWLFASATKISFQYVCVLVGWWCCVVSQTVLLVWSLFLPQFSLAREHYSDILVELRAKYSSSGLLSWVIKAESSRSHKLLPSEPVGERERKRKSRSAPQQTFLFCHSLVDRIVH